MHLYNNIVQKEKRQNINIKSVSRQISLEILREVRAKLEEHDCRPKLPRTSSDKILLEKSAEPASTVGSTTGKQAIVKSSKSLSY